MAEATGSLQGLYESPILDLRSSCENLTASDSTDQGADKSINRSSPRAI